MRVFESLSLHSSIKIGGVAEVVSPSSVEDFVACYGHGPVTGAGTNILWKPTTRRTVKSRQLNEITRLDPCSVRAQCGVLNRSLLQFGLANGLGGLEYLASIPGTIGGAVFMNAGRGRKHDCAIGQRIVEVEYFDGNDHHRASRDECGFGYRTSCFHEHPDWMIISVTLRLKRQTLSRTRDLIQTRLRDTAMYQDAPRQHPDQPVHCATGAARAQASVLASAG